MDDEQEELLNEEGLVEEHYRCNEDSRLGRLTSSRAKIRCDLFVGDPYWEALDRSLSISNKHILVTKFFDKERPAVITLRYDKTVPDYVTELKNRGLMPLVDFKIPSTTHHKHKYMPQEYKYLVKAMVDCVVDLHEKDKLSLCEFTLEDWVIKDGVPQFWVPMTIPLTEETRKADLQCLEKTIRTLFDNNCPPILKDLFKKMAATEDVPEERRLPVHLSLLSPSALLHFIRDAFEKRDEFIPDSNEMALYDAAVEGIGDHKGWTRRFVNDKSTTTYGAATDCFNFSHKPDQGKSYQDYGSNFVVNSNMLRFLRNMASHLRSHLRKRGVQFNITDDYVALIIMTLFQPRLLAFHDALYTQGMLGHFFPSCKKHDRKSNKEAENDEEAENE